MSRTSTVGQRIVGSVVGLLAGGVVGAALALLLAIRFFRDPDQSADWDFVLIGLGFVAGAFVGAAGGATVVQKALRQTSSFWKALLGTFVGLLVEGPLSLPLSYAFCALVAPRLEGMGSTIVPLVIICALMVAGAVIGSGWKAKDKPTAPSTGTWSPT